MLQGVFFQQFIKKEALHRTLADLADKFQGLREKRFAPWRLCVRLCNHSCGIEAELFNIIHDNLFTDRIIFIFILFGNL